MARIFLTSPAQHDYDTLPEDVRQRIESLLNSAFADNPFRPQFRTRKLKRPLIGYRVRVGRYRVLFKFDGVYIEVFRIRDRKDAYR